MKTYLFSELSQEAQENATGLYYADRDYQDAIIKLYEELPDEILLFGDFAEDAGLRFNAEGERVA